MRARARTTPPLSPPNRSLCAPACTSAKLRFASLVLLSFLPRRCACHTSCCHTRSARGAAGTLLRPGVPRPRITAHPCPPPSHLPTPFPSIFPPPKHGEPPATRQAGRLMAGRNGACRRSVRPLRGRRRRKRAQGLEASNMPRPREKMLSPRGGKERKGHRAGSHLGVTPPRAHRAADAAQAASALWPVPCG